jgi:hypothetical protein
MYIGLVPFHQRAVQRTVSEADVNAEEAEAIARYQSAQALAGVIQEATRRAEAMARLERSLSWTG